jgi:putative FmdB family regulatory protein
MPIYEYRCTSCGHRTDIVHGINDPGPAFCPSCGTEATMRKQFAAPAIHYKGSGWAKKDRGAAGSGAKTTSASAKKAPTTDTAAPATSAAASGGGGTAEKPATDSAASASGGSGE